MKKTALFLTILLLFLSACAPTSAPTPDMAATEDAIARRLIATMTAQVPTEIPTPTATDTPTATETPAPTNTPTSTDTATPTDTPTATATATAAPAPTDTPAPMDTPEPTLTDTPTPVPTGPCCPELESGKGLLWFENRTGELAQADVGPNYCQIPAMDVNYISGCACLLLDPGHHQAIVSCVWGTCHPHTFEIDIAEGQVYHLMLAFKGY